MSSTATTVRPVSRADWQTAGEQGPSRLEINLIFTNQRATVYALETVECLARDLGACVRLRAAIVVPYSLAVDESPVSVPFLERSLFDLISRLARDGFEATAHLYFCRDRNKALLQVLGPNALVVIGGKKRCWLTDASRLARALRSAGHRVVFVDSKRGIERICAEEPEDASSSLPEHSTASLGTGEPHSTSGQGEGS